MKQNFLNNEMILSVIQVAQLQITAYREFLKLCDGDIAEASRQTVIYMSAAFYRPIAEPDEKKEGSK